MTKLKLSVIHEGGVLQSLLLTNVVIGGLSLNRTHSYNTIGTANWKLSMGTWSNDDSQGVLVFYVVCLRLAEILTKEVLCIIQICP